jgi:DNA-binding transcriptional ArsR family regulator
MLVERIMKAATIFKAIAEPRRIELLQILRDRGELSVGELAERVSVTQQAVSLHLKVLETAGLVEARRDGTRHLYAVRHDGFVPANEFLASFWGEKLKNLKAQVEKKSR